jgi:hypothetical protein
MKNDVEGLEMGPHRMRWIRQTPVGECISRQQVTEIILKRWCGAGIIGNKPTRTTSAAAKQSSTLKRRRRATVASQRSALASRAAPSCG